MWRTALGKILKKVNAQLHTQENASFTYEFRFLIFIKGSLGRTFQDAKRAKRYTAALP